MRFIRLRLNLSSKVKLDALFFTLSILSTTLLDERSAWSLHFTDLKGFQENLILRDEYEYLTPFQAFSLARLGLLTNLYNYPNSSPDSSYSNNKHQSTAQKTT